MFPTQTPLQEEWQLCASTVSYTDFSPIISTTFCPLSVILTREVFKADLLRVPDMLGMLSLASPLRCLEPCGERPSTRR